MRYREQRILEDSRISRLVERQDVDVVTFIFLDDILGVLVGIERVHEDERHVHIVGAVEIFDLSYREIEKRHALTNLNDGLRTNASHGRAKTTIQFENSELVEILNGFRVCQGLIIDDLISLWRSDMIPVSTKSHYQRDLFTVFRRSFEHTEWYPLPCRSGICGREQRSCPSQSQITRSRRSAPARLGLYVSMLTFFNSGSLTVSASLFKALRIWLAATEVEVFSKAFCGDILLILLIRKMMIC